MIFKKDSAVKGYISFGNTDEVFEINTQLEELSTNEKFLSVIKNIIKEDPDISVFIVKNQKPDSSIQIRYLFIKSLSVDARLAISKTITYIPGVEMWLEVELDLKTIAYISHDNIDGFIRIMYYEFEGICKHILAGRQISNLVTFTAFDYYPYTYRLYTGDDNYGSSTNKEDL